MLISRKASARSTELDIANFALLLDYLQRISVWLTHNA